MTAGDLITDVITKVYASGGRLIVDPDRPRIITPSRFKTLVQANKGLLLRAINLAEVPRRAAIFRQQLSVWVQSGRPGDVVPTLALPDAPEPQAGYCISCGTEVDREAWRCDTCRVAVLDALSKEKPYRR